MKADGTGERVAEAGDDSVAVELVRDRRLKRTIRWEWTGDRLRIRVPEHLRQSDIDRQVTEIVEDVKRRRARVRARADVDLEARARELSRRYFGGELAWHSIRWVTNMTKRVGSCTVNGPTAGDIRLSRRIEKWPEWVVDYVLVHELAHVKYPNHGAEFWAYVGRYPLAERARGFLLGVALNTGEDEETWL